MSRSSQAAVIDALERALGVELRAARLDIRPWGSIDAGLRVRDNRWLLVEVEAGQCHPNTNVLKLWPHLEDDSDLSVFLIHAFCTDAVAKTSSRAKLASWLASRMRKQLGRRFSYLRVNVDMSSGAINNRAELKNAVAKWRKIPLSKSRERSLER